MTYGSHHPNRLDGHVTTSAFRRVFAEQKFVFPFRNLKQYDQITLVTNFVPCPFFIYVNNVNNITNSPNFLCAVLKNSFKVFQKRET